MDSDHWTGRQPRHKQDVNMSACFAVGVGSWSCAFLFLGRHARHRTDRFLFEIFWAEWAWWWTVEVQHLNRVITNAYISYLDTLLRLTPKESEPGKQLRKQGRKKGRTINHLRKVSCSRHASLVRGLGVQFSIFEMVHESVVRLECGNLCVRSLLGPASRHGPRWRARSRFLVGRKVDF